MYEYTTIPGDSYNAKNTYYFKNYKHVTFCVIMTNVFLIKWSIVMYTFNYYVYQFYVNKSLMLKVKLYNDAVNKIMQ